MPISPIEIDFIREGLSFINFFLDEKVAKNQGFAAFFDKTAVSSLKDLRPRKKQNALNQIAV